jgi:hypothetical protein
MAIIEYMPLLAGQLGGQLGVEFFDEKLLYINKLLYF